MSIKSTIYLKRPEALELYHRLRAKLFGDNSELTNHQLGEQLDMLRELECELAGWTCYDNYLVQDP